MDGEDNPSTDESPAAIIAFCPNIYLYMAKELISNLGFTNIIGAPNHTTTLWHVVRLVHFLDPILYGGLFSPKSGQ